MFDYEYILGANVRLEGRGRGQGRWAGTGGRAPAGGRTQRGPAHGACLLPRVRAASCGRP